MSGDKDRRPVVLYGVTAGISAFSLLKGQLSWFARQGWDVVLATTPDPKAYAAAEREGTAFHPLPMSRSISLVSDLKALRGWVRLIGRLRPDVVNVGTPKASLLGSFAAFLRRVPKRIYVMRGLRLEGARGPMAAVLWLMERLTIACATDVIFVSRSLAAEAAGRGLGARRKGWIIGEGSSNGVDVDALRARAGGTDRAAVRAELGVEDDDFVVGFVGRIARDKGLDTLLRAFLVLAPSRNVRLLVVGGVEDEELAAQVRALGDRVVMTGDVDNVPHHLLAMDVLCLPTKREGFPNVVLEAGAMGLPVVTTRATGAVDSVIDGETGLLVDVDDHQGLAHALEKLHADPSAARAMGECALERVVRDFTPESVWQGVLAIMTNDYRAGGLHPVLEMSSPSVTKEES